MWEKGKTDSRTAKGVIILVFILLFIQFLFFAFKIVEKRKVNATALSVAAYGEPRQQVSGEGRGEPSPSNGGNSSKAPSAEGNSLQQEKKKGKNNSSKREQVLPWWEVPIELNAADSAALVSLRGIGPYYAKRIMEFREKLGGSYASVEQLLDIKGIDSTKFEGFVERVYIDSSLIKRIDLYTLPYDSLVAHPYIGPYAAKGIERMRRLLPREEFSIDSLVNSGVLPRLQGERLKPYQRR